MISRAEVLRDALMKDTRPVSVDISCTVYNHGKYLREALNGMLMQETNFPYKIIIHDDASTDDSSVIIREYQAKYPDKITAVIEEENLYQNGKSIISKMIPYYTAKYIASCEGDDYWIDKNKLQKQVDYLEKNPDCIACYHNILPVNVDGKYDESLRNGYDLLEEGDYSEKEIKRFALKTQTASLVRRNFFSFMSETDCNVFKTTKCNGDEKTLLICGVIGRVHFLPDVMAAHRRVFNGDSYTARQFRKSKIDILIGREQRILEKCKFYNYFTGKQIYPYNQIICDRIIFLSKYYKELDKGGLEKLHHTLPIPIYAYLVFIPYSFLIIIRKFCRYGINKISMAFANNRK